MKGVLCALAILWTACVPIYAQTGVNGTWRVEGVGQSFPWELVLKADGTMLTGAVNSCASVQGAFPIYDGKAEGNKISFKCKSGNQQRIITFAGSASTDQIAFTWELQDLNPNPPASSDGMFGNTAPRRFTAKRVPDDEFTKRVNDAAEQAAKTTPGNEFVASVNLIPKGVKAEGRLFIPGNVIRVRSVILVIGWGRGFDLYDAPQWRRLVQTLQSGMLLARITPINTQAPGGPFVNSANLGGGDSVLMLLQSLAQESGHPELTDAPLLLWAHSAAGGFEPTFASAHPDRTIGFIQYHSGGGAMTVPKALSEIPGLILKGGKDTSVVGNSEDFANSGRAVGAPWTFSLDPDATHGEMEYLNKANDLMIPWVTAVVRQRIGSDGNALRDIPDNAAWLGDNRTGEAAPYTNFTGAKATASWLPDEASARAWQVLRAVEK